MILGRLPVTVVPNYRVMAPASLWRGTGQHQVPATASRPALVPTLLPIQWLLGTPSSGVKWLGCEADHSPPSSAVVKNTWSYTSTSSVHLHGVVLH